MNRRKAYTARIERFRQPSHKARCFKSVNFQAMWIQAMWIEVLGFDSLSIDFAWTDLVWTDLVWIDVSRGHLFRQLTVHDNEVGRNQQHAREPPIQGNLQGVRAGGGIGKL